MFFKASAEFSEDRVYRYSLLRQWGGEKPMTINFIMLNPSTADEHANDPTVERCQRRTADWGYEKLIVTNLFALRSTDPSSLVAAADPVGPKNDEFLIKSAFEADHREGPRHPHGRNQKADSNSLIIGDLNDRGNDEDA